MAQKQWLFFCTLKQRRCKKIETKKTFADLLGEDSIDKEMSYSNTFKDLYEISIDRLIPFDNHPFKLYEGDRFNDMVDSIKEYGVITPIIVRKLDDNYQIISGHNRVKAAKLVGLEKLPAIIKNYSDDEAMLIVTESNLIQRSFSELAYSERACIIATRHNTMKRQGVRTDIIEEIENLSKQLDIEESETSCQLGTKLDSNQIIGDKYNLSRRSIARYLRIAKLIDEIKELIDESTMPLGSGVCLSYLNDQDQLLVHQMIMQINKGKLDIHKAQRIKKLSKQNKINQVTLEEVLLLKKDDKKAKTKFNINSNIIDRFFDKKTKKKDIEDTIEKALDLYFKSQG